MSFDPYHMWLGIPPEDQPANHYRLLGLKDGESNPDVIACAADKQVSHVRTGTDYAFRIFVDKSIWSQVLIGLNEEMDYDNFKSEIARHQGSAGADYEHSLHEVWSVMNRLQIREDV